MKAKFVGEPLIMPNQTTPQSENGITQLFTALSREYEGSSSTLHPVWARSHSGLKNTNPFFRTDSEREERVNLILKKNQSSDELVLLDERGKSYGSVEFSELIQKKKINSG